MNYLSKALNKAFKDGKIGYYFSKAGAVQVTHLMYADDLLIFANGSKRSISNLMSVINEFCSISGESINNQKSSIYFGESFTLARIRATLKLTKFKQGHFPIKYLGARLYIGTGTQDTFQYLVEAVQNRINGWIKNFLSMAGRASLIQSVLNTLCLHSLSVLPIPAATLKKIQTLICNFLWDSGSQSKMHWISWQKICCPKNEGGLGLRSIDSFKKCLLAKLAWRFLKNESLWMQFIRSKRKRNSQDFDSYIWRHIKKHVSRLRSETYWHIGQGNTPVGVFAEWVNVNIPREYYSWSLKQLHDDQATLQCLLQSHIGILRNFFIDVSFNEYKDMISWRVTKSGVFSTKAFYDYTRHYNATNPIFINIWQTWIPPKYSVLLWRLLHNSLPTDDKIAAKGIYMVSKCQCCSSPNLETMDHIFFNGKTALYTWRLIGRILQRTPPSCIEDLKNHWLLPLNKKHYDSCLALLITMVTIWELWSFRNKSRMDGLKLNVFMEILRMVPGLSHLIKAKSGDVQFVTFLCKVFHLKLPPISAAVHSAPKWLPVTWGFSLNCTINVKHNQLYFGGIFRDSQGKFIQAVSLISERDSIIAGIIDCLECSVCPLHAISVIQSSHEDMSFIAKDIIPWESLRDWRKLKSAIQDTTKFQFISVQENHVAVAISYLGVIDNFTDVDQLPIHIRNAIDADIS